MVRKCLLFAAALGSFWTFKLGLAYVRRVAPSHEVAVWAQVRTLSEAINIGVPYNFER